MISAPLRLSRVSTAIAIVFALAAAPAAAGGYLKLGGVKGQTSAAGSHRDEIHIESYSWGRSQTAGKMHMEDISAAPTDGAKGAKGGNVEYEWKVEEGESAPPRPTRPSDVTMKRGTTAGDPDRPIVAGRVPNTSAARESTEMGGTEDINIGVGELQEATISKSMDMANPKLTQFSSPAPRGSMTAIVPAGTCRRGARYPTAELGTGDRVYTMTGVVVTGCSAAASGGSAPMEHLSLNYQKIIWK